MLGVGLMPGVEIGMVPVVYLFNISVLAYLAFEDARRRIIPNRVVIPATICGFALSPWGLLYPDIGQHGAKVNQTSCWAFLTVIPIY